jgi:RNA polymerase sigma-70 factor (ECF subfamily)
MELFAFDDDYVRRLREGERWTVQHYEQYFSVFLALKLRGRIPPGDIDDVIQEVHMRVYAALRGDNGPRDGHKFGAYVNSICNNVVLERGRRDHHDEEIVEDVPSLFDLFSELVTKETQERVQRTLSSLGTRDAEILRAVFIDELDKDEICRRFEVDRNYLRVLVHRALEKFRQKFDGK